MIKPLQTVVAVAAAAAIFAPAALAVDIRANDVRANDVRARIAPRVDVRVDIRHVRHASRTHPNGSSWS
jgi:hypothetical protein